MNHSFTSKGGSESTSTEDAKYCLMWVAHSMEDGIGVWSGWFRGLVS